MYQELLTPFILVPFEEMNKKQVVQYFDWFINTKSERMRYLQEYIFNHKGEVVIDKSPKSLIDLWIWFKERIVWEEETQEVIENRLKSSPKWMHSHILEDTTKLSTQTLMVV